MMERRQITTPQIYCKPLQINPNFLHHIYFIFLPVMNAYYDMATKRFFWGRKIGWFYILSKRFPQKNLMHHIRFAEKSLAHRTTWYPTPIYINGSWQISWTPFEIPISHEPWKSRTYWKKNKFCIFPIRFEVVLLKLRGGGMATCPRHAMSAIETRNIRWLVIGFRRR